MSVARAGRAAAGTESPAVSTQRSHRSAPNSMSVPSRSTSVLPRPQCCPVQVAACGTAYVGLVGGEDAGVVRRLRSPRVGWREHLSNLGHARCVLQGVLPACEGRGSRRPPSPCLGEPRQRRRHRRRRDLRHVPSDCTYLRAWRICSSTSPARSRTVSSSSSWRRQKVLAERVELGLGAVITVCSQGLGEPRTYWTAS